jgi:hypothetical protein
MSVMSEIGPSGQSRWQVRAQARDLMALAQLALDCTVEGPRCDVQRASGALDRMRAVLGGGDSDGE